MKKKRMKKGLTLIELIVVLALVTMVIGTASSMIVFSFKAQKKVTDEYQIQSDMRLASEVVNQQVRYATAIFLLNGNQFSDSGDLKSGWDYFALSDDKKQIVHYKWTGTAHSATSLVNTHSDMVFGLDFKGLHGNERVVEFNLNAFIGNNKTPKVSISSILDTLNSVVVDDSGSYASPSIALAYRAEDIPEAEQVKVAVTMILDRSASMRSQIGNGDDSQRDEVMRAKAKNLIDVFKNMDNVHVSLIPFGTLASANEFLEVELYHQVLKDTISGYSGLIQTGTNAGDGLRRSYYKHIDFSSSNDNILHYTILLMDGNPTHWVRKGNNNQFYYGSSNSSHDMRSGGNGKLEEVDNSKLYINNLASNTVKKIGSSLDNMKTFIIGFSGDNTDVSNAEDIAGYYNVAGSDNIKSSYYFANNTQALENAFQAIVDSILEDTWHIYGPNN